MRLRAILFATASLALAAPGCSNKQRVHTEKQIAQVLVSDEQETAIGQAVKGELTRQGLRYVEDPDVQAYVDNIGRTIFKHAEKDRKGVKWHVHVVDDPKTVNAFATPGGHLYLTSGLLTAAEDEAEVAGVLAHEAGHVVARHGARQMVNMMGLQTVAAIALGEDPNQLAMIAANLAANGLLLAHSREDEHEADRHGVVYAARAGYDPRGITRFFKKLQAKQGEMPKQLVWLSTHPATSERIRRVDDLIVEKKLTGGKREEMRHAAVREILERQPVRGTEPVETP